MSVRFTALFSKQIEEALSYVRDRSPSGADSLSQRITEALELLNDQPRSGRPTTKKSIHRLRLSSYPYVIFYRIVGDDALVLRFVHAKRRTAR
ncbi:type II toxin-antitoxin system RelE/ParE family toxin [Neorhizobium alkalisoli]|uniref:type II toxin-antitoxin system RelE/ParE family toxin n=1 Tax=Neorhizobium alkalisoli TaxID=528178 RepID=UPI001649214B